MAYPSLRGKMHHIVELVLPKQRIHGRRIRDIKLCEGELRGLPELLDPILLEAHAVIAVKIINADDKSLLLQQATRHMKSHKPGGTGHEHLPWARHGSRPTEP